MPSFIAVVMGCSLASGQAVGEPSAKVPADMRSQIKLIDEKNELRKQVVKSTYETEKAQEQTKNVVTDNMTMKQKISALGKEVARLRAKTSLSDKENEDLKKLVQQRDKAISDYKFLADQYQQLYDDVKTENTLLTQKYSSEIVKNERLSKIVSRMSKNYYKECSEIQFNYGSIGAVDLQKAKSVWIKDLNLKTCYCVPTADLAEGKPSDVITVYFKIYRQENLNATLINAPVLLNRNILESDESLNCYEGSQRINLINAKAKLTNGSYTYKVLYNENEIKIGSFLIR